MKVTPNDRLASELLSEMMAEIEEDRSNQPSVSTLIDCLTKGYFNSQGNKVELSDKTKVFFLVGLGLEKALLVKRKEWPIAGVHDGIHFHVDSAEVPKCSRCNGAGEYYSTEGLTGIPKTCPCMNEPASPMLIELKSTRSSLKRAEEGDFSDRHIKQVKSYCKALGITSVDLAMVFIIPAEFRVFHIEFTQEELDNHWNGYMIPRRDVYNEARRTNTIPTPFKYAEEWECKDCSYKLICETLAGKKLKV